MPVVGMEGPVMKVTRIFVAGLAIATLGLGANASAQEWGPPPATPTAGWVSAPATTARTAPSTPRAGVGYDGAMAGAMRVMATALLSAVSRPITAAGPNIVVGSGCGSVGDPGIFLPCKGRGTSEAGGGVSPSR